jgi:importin subunit alpha-6/7
MFLIVENPPIQQVIDFGVVPYLVRLLQNDDNPALQIEAVRAIASIADSDRPDDIGYLIEAGVVPILIRLLSLTNESVRSEAAGALGNIAGDYEDYAEYRDVVLEAGALPALLEATEKKICPQILFAISTLCRGYPIPDFELIRPALPLLGRLLHSQDEEFVKYSCISLSFIILHRSRT